MKILSSLALATLGLTALVGRADAAPCSTTLNELKEVRKDFVQSSPGPGGVGRFALGASTGFGLTADCDKLEAYANIALTGQIAVVQVRPFEVRLAATTKKNGRNALDLKFMTFGYTIDTLNIAERSEPIEYARQHDLTLPGNFTGEWSVSAGIAGGNASLTVNWNTVTQGGDILTIKVAPTGVEAGYMAAMIGNMNASVRGRYVKRSEWGTIDESVTGSGGLSLYDIILGGSSYMKPARNSPGKWVAGAAYSFFANNVLGGRIGVNIPVYGNWDIISVAPLSFDSTDQVTKEFVKQF